MSATDNAYKSARRMRRDLSLPEVLLWQRLRGHKPKLRRQHPIGRYVLDFYCAQSKLAFEIDGIAHDLGDRPERDEKRLIELKSMGLEIVRIAAADVLRNPDAIADRMSEMCSAPLHRAEARSPSPSADGEDQQ